MLVEALNFALADDRHIECVLFTQNGFFHITKSQAGKLGFRVVYNSECIGRGLHLSKGQNLYRTDLLARKTSLFFWHFAELDELAYLLAAFDAFQCLLLDLVGGKRAEIVSDAANTRKNTGALDTLGKAAQYAQVVFATISYYFYVCHMSEYPIMRVLFLQLFLDL